MMCDSLEGIEKSVIIKVIKGKILELWGSCSLGDTYQAHDELGSLSGRKRKDS